MNAMRGIINSKPVLARSYLLRLIAKFEKQCACWASPYRAPYAGIVHCTALQFTLPRFEDESVTYHKQFDAAFRSSQRPYSSSTKPCCYSVSSNWRLG